jgi:chloride channel protein, CIC family
MRFPKLRFQLAEPLRPGELEITLMWAGLVGLMGAVSSSLFRELIHSAQFVFWQRTDDLVLAAEAIPWWQRLLVPTVGGMFAGLAIQAGTRFARGQTSTDFMEAVAIGDGTIRVRPSLVKSTSSLLSVASGGSIGREGAMAQLSTMFASWMGRHAGLSKPRLKLMVACGAAAGIAAAYNAPLAGALFVAEIVLGSISMESLGPLLFASVISTGFTRQFVGAEPLFVIPPFHLVSPLELIPYLVLGVLLGVCAPWFVRLLRASEKAFASLRAPVFVRLALGGAIVGLLSLILPQVFGNGYTTVSQILEGNWAWRALAAVLVFKLVATVATIGSGAVGGVFTPTLFMGAALGYLIGVPVHSVWEGATAEPSAYALVGMGGFLAATTHAPLMAMLMVFEITLDYGIVLPLMLACVVAYYTSRGIDPRSIYSASLKRKEQAEPPEEPALPATIESLVKPDPVTVPEDMRFRDLVETFKQHRHNYLYVTDPDGRFQGAIALHDIKAYLSDAVLRDLIIASELMHPEFPTLERDATMAQALERFLPHDGERLPVIDGHGGHMLVGSISKTDLLLTLSLRSKRKVVEPAGRDV